jgi:purine-binding chemotaxis protein CheW
MTRSEAAQRILEERAARLAQPIATGAANALRDMIVLAVDGSRYGIELRFVMEVVRNPSVAAVPNTPEIVAGVVNWRGHVLPVFDLGRLFGRPATGPGDTAVIIGLDEAEFAVLAGDDIERASIPNEDIRTDVSAAFESGQALVRGITDQAVVVLDGEILLRDRRLFAGAAGDGDPSGKGGTV